MKTTPTLSTALILTVASVAVCADDNRQLQEQLIGEWINVDKQAGTKRVVITKEEDSWSINTWGSQRAGGTTEIPHKERQLHLLGSSVMAESLDYGFASYDAGFKEVHNVVHLEKEQLIVETFNVFKDETGRSNYRLRDVFERKK